MANSTNFITLYYVPSACSLVVHLALRHLDIPFNVVPLKFSPGEGGGWNLSAADGSFDHHTYRMLHPKSKVPGLRIPISATGEAAVNLISNDSYKNGPLKLTGSDASDLTNAAFLTEMPAILDFIGSLTPAGIDLLGGEAASLRRARVMEWTSWLIGHVQSINWTDMRSDLEEVRKRGLQASRVSYQRINDLLVDREFAVGDQVTVADFNLYCWYRTGQFYKVGDLEKEWPAFAAHAKRIEQLAAVRLALEDEGLTSAFAKE